MFHTLLYSVCCGSLGPEKSRLRTLFRALVISGLPIFDVGLGLGLDVEISLESSIPTRVTWKCISLAVNWYRVVQ